MLDNERNFREMTPEQRAAAMAKAHARVAFMTNRIYSPTESEGEFYFYEKMPIQTIQSKDYENNNTKIESKVVVLKAGLKDSVEVFVFTGKEKKSYVICADNILYVSGYGWIKARDIQPGENISCLLDGVFSTVVTLAVKSAAQTQYFLTKSENIGNFAPESGFLTYSHCKAVDKKRENLEKQKQKWKDRN